MAGILSIRCKAINNQSINQNKNVGLCEEFYRTGTTPHDFKLQDLPLKIE